MRLFGHFVAPAFVLLASLDGALFMAALHLISLGPHCERCYLGSIIRLNPLEILALTGAFLLLTASVGLYNEDAFQSFRTFLKRFIVSWQIIFALSVGFLAVSKAAAGMPFGWYVGILSLAIALFMVLLFTLRVVLVWGLRLSFIKRRVIVLGEGQIAEQVARFLRESGRSHLEYVQTIKSVAVSSALVALPTSDRVLRLRREEPVTLSAAVAALNADEVVVAVEDRRGLPFYELLECKLNGVDVTDALMFWERETGQIDLAHAGVGWLSFSGGFVLNQSRRVLKRALDIAVSLSFLIFMLPVIVPVAIAIKLESPGPVFYRQERVGLGGKIFRVWKFRSMREDAERDGVPRWAAASDDRVTRVGKIIRMLRIDEIPQVFNVLNGEMSFIGPRPERPFFVEQLREQIPYYDLRHRMRPGITGWAQVNYPYGASIEDARRKLAFDLYYLKKNDLLMDIAILMQTVRVIVFGYGSR